MNRYTTFHGNPTNGLLAEAWLRTNGQTFFFLSFGAAAPGRPVPHHYRGF